MRKKMFFVSIIIISIVFIFTIDKSVFASEWLYDRTVTQIGTYNAGYGHYVWISGGHGEECLTAQPANPILHFDESLEGGKSLMAVLLTALVSSRNVDVDVDNCEIQEVYIK